MIDRLLSRPFFRFLPMLLCIGIILYFSSIPSGFLVNGSKTLVDRLDEDKYYRVGKVTLIINQWKAGHIIGYAGAGAGLLFGFSRITRRPWIWALFLAALIAIADEVRQSYTPGRHAAWQDVLLDIVSAGLMILLLIFVHRWKRGSRNDVPASLL